MKYQNVLAGWGICAALWWPAVAHVESLPSLAGTTEQAVKPVDGKLYLDDEYAPTGPKQGVYVLTMPLPLDAARKAWRVQAYYLDGGKLRLDGYVNAADYVSGKMVLGYKVYLEDGQLGLESALDAKGRRSGDTVSYYENGKVLRRASYKNDVQSGPQVRYHDNGQVLESITYANDQVVDGEYARYDEAGHVVARSNYKNGVLSGPYTEYFPNGKLKHSGPFLNGDQHGPVVNYDENGKVRSTMAFAHNRPDGEAIEYYANGGVAQKEQYTDGVQRSQAVWNEKGIQTLSQQWDENHREVGEFKEWYEDGRPKVLKPYVNGKLQGTAKLWFENGQLQSSTEYVDGREQGRVVRWRDDGSLDEDCKYERGQQVGRCKRP